MRKTIAVDFDGVLHDYDGEWRGPEHLPGQPIAGAVEAVRSYLGEYDVVVFSARAETPQGVHAIRRWLVDNRFPLLNVTHVKPPAVLYIDDRGWHFDGRWPTLGEIRSFRPWNRPDAPARGTCTLAQAQSIIHEVAWVLAEAGYGEAAQVVDDLSADDIRLAAVHPQRSRRPGPPPREVHVDRFDPRTVEPGPWTAVGPGPRFPVLLHRFLWDLRLPKPASCNLSFSSEPTSPPSGTDDEYRAVDVTLETRTVRYEKVDR